MNKCLVFWSPLAEETYLKILTQILDNWTIKEAVEFQFKVESLIDKIRKHNCLCPASVYKPHLRRCVITSQTSLVYQINEGNIELVVFLDNRADYQY